MIHECTLCGAEAAWIDDGGPPDGWVFLERLIEPLCGACLGSLALGPNAAQIVRRESHLRQSANIFSCERFAVTPEDERVLRWLDFEPADDGAGRQCWRWMREPDVFAALAPVRQALCHADFERRFGRLPPQPST